MMFKKLYFVWMAASLLSGTACSQEEITDVNRTGVTSKSDQALPQHADDAGKADVALEAFSEFPEEVDGCSCYFSRSEKELAEGKYIYLNDFANTSFIQLNGELRKLELKLHEAGSPPYYIYADAEYELRVDIGARQAAGDELERVTGEMTLTRLKDNRTTKADYVGECGC